MNNLINQKKQQLKIAVNTLEQISPKAILDRGFSLVFDENGKLLRDASQTKIGENLTINLAKGKILANVESIKTTEN